MHTYIEHPTVFMHTYFEHPTVFMHTYLEHLKQNKKILMVMTTYSYSKKRKLLLKHACKHTKLHCMHQTPKMYIQQLLCTLPSCQHQKHHKQQIKQQQKNSYVRVKAKKRM